LTNRIEGRRLEETDAFVVGIDGFKGGWLCALWHGPGSRPEARSVATLAHAVQALPAHTPVIAVDIPLGLPEASTPGGRACDVAARSFLKGKTSSVFSPPARPTPSAETYQEACQVNANSGPFGKKLSRQSYALLPKLRDAEAAVAHSSWLRDRIIEVHPEVSFGKLASAPVLSLKRKPEGRDARRGLLRKAGFVDLETYEREARDLGAAVDDALDACAAAWTARRYWREEAGCRPENAEGPAHAFRIWY
jgi:predicted RNase H-like nuclease